LEEEKNRLHQEITEIRSNIESLKPNFLTQTDWLSELEQKKLLAQSGKEKIQTLQTELEQRKRSIADLVGRWNWSFETPTATWKSWKSETELLFKRMNITVEEVEKEVLLCSQQKQNAQQWLESEKQLELKRNQITQNESSQKTLANEIQEIAQQLQGPSMELELAQKKRGSRSIGGGRTSKNSRCVPNSGNFGGGTTVCGVWIAGTPLRASTVR